MGNYWFGSKPEVIGNRIVTTTIPELFQNPTKGAILRVINYRLKHYKSQPDGNVMIGCTSNVQCDDVSKLCNVEIYINDFKYQYKLDRVELTDMHPGRVILLVQTQEIGCYAHGYNDVMPENQTDPKKLLIVD